VPLSAAKCRGLPSALLYDDHYSVSRRLPLLPTVSKTAFLPSAAVGRRSSQIDYASANVRGGAPQPTKLAVSVAI
jgi:hypothetical protein